MAGQVAPKQPRLALLCPACGQQALTRRPKRLVCSACDAGVPNQDGVYDLAPDAGETQLDVDSYAGAGPLPDRQVRQLARTFEAVLDTMGGPEAAYPEVLEIGAGHGPQTWTFTQSGRYGRVYATDISMAFLRRLAENLPQKKVIPLRVPGEALTIPDQSLDLVVGRSALHHIADYRGLLENARRWLRPGGIAMFFEPNLDGKMWVAFYLEMILRLSGGSTPEDMTRRGRVAHRLKSIGRRTPPSASGFALSSDIQHRLREASVHIRKDFVFDDIEARRPHLEDKHIFGIDGLLKTARAAGFSEASYHDQDQSRGVALKRIRMNIHNMIGVGPDALTAFEPLFDAFEASFGLSDAVTPVSPMGWFAFRA